MKKFLRKNIYIIVLIIIAIIRILLTSKLTVIHIGNSVVDDLWGIYTAWNLKEGNWQGLYSSNVMIKGITSSLLLVLSSSIGVSYINFATILYVGSIGVFIYSIRNLIKNKYILLLIYIILIFNPIMLGKEIIQRCYRNSFVPSLSLYIISMYILMLIQQNSKKKMILYNIITGVLLSLFWNLREDSIWIIPFIIFINIFIFLKEYKNTKKIVSNIAILLIPIIITIIFNNIICLINYKYYGVYQRIDFAQNTIFSKTCNYIKKIEYPNVDDMNSVTKEKLEMLFHVSPTLNQYSKEILMFYDRYDECDNSPGNKILNNGWFTWSMRTAFEAAKLYEEYDLVEDTYLKIYKELKEAENSGKIKIKNGFYDKSNTIKTFIKSIKDAFLYITNFKEIETDIDYKSSYVVYMSSKLYNEITLNKIIYQEEDIKEHKIVSLEEQNQYLEKYGYIEVVLNNISEIYKKCNFIFFIISIIAYLIITYNFIIKKKYELKNDWVIASGMLGSVFTIICGVAYINSTACKAINYFYLSGTYSLILIFEFITIYNIFKLLGKKKEKC